MKKIIPVVSIVLLVLTLAACGGLLDSFLIDPALQGRLESFVAKINDQDWENLYTEMHPDALNYEQSKDGAVWSALFPNSDYAIPFNPSTEGQEEGIRTMNSSISYVVADSTITDPIIAFTFKQSGSLWYIYKIVWGSDEIFRKLK
ncbi:MAG: hypothetical protein JW760_01110 [Spirochaetales bacterium]|nr:hypothetical protein [Spirochaetales bacterium]